MFLADQVFLKLTLKYVAKHWTRLSILKFMVWVGGLGYSYGTSCLYSLLVGLINLHYTFKTTILIIIIRDLISNLVLHTNDK